MRLEVGGVSISAPASFLLFFAWYYKDYLFL